jgi:hypothetical protein
MLFSCQLAFVTLEVIGIAVVYQIVELLQDGLRGLCLGEV